jgi:hypothetical protein
MKLSEQNKAMLASYGRSVLGAALALYMSGVTDPKTLAYSLLAAIAPVALRALNPNDTAFGRMPAVSALQDALASLSVKAPAKKKKAPAKKKTGGGGKPQQML